MEIALIGDVDVHSFREEKNYIVDVAFQQPEKPPALPQPMADASHAPAKAAAAKAAQPTAAPAASRRAAAAAGRSPGSRDAGCVRPQSEPPAPPRQAGQIVPPTSETFAKEANIEIKPEAPKAAEPPASEPPAAEAPAIEAPATEVPNVEHAKPAAVAVAEPPQKPKMTPAAVVPPAETAPPSAAGAADGDAVVDARRNSDGLNLTFSFAAATPAALFRRADAVWLVFDTAKPIDVEPIRSKGGAIIADVSAMKLDNGQAIRIRLNRPQLPSLTSEDEAGISRWTLTFADAMRTPTQPLVAIRNIADPASANVTVPLAKPGRLHRLVDPDAGDTIMVVTAPAPIRGFIKRQDFVELSLLESIHGVAVRPNSDDVTIEVAPDKIMLGRPGGLTLSCGRIRRGARDDRGAAGVRSRRVAQEPGRKIHRAGGRAGRGGGGGRA